MAQYTGELFALMTALSWTIGIFPFTDAARKLGATSLNYFRLSLAVVLLSIVVMITGGISPVALFSLPSPSNWLWLGLSGVIGLSLGDYFWFNALVIIGPRVSSTFSTLAPGGALLFGYVLIGETINMVGILGIAVTVGGVLWLILGKRPENIVPDYGHGSRTKGYVFAVIASLCQGGGLVLAKMGLTTPSSPQFSPIHGTWIRMLVATAVLFLISLPSGRLKEYMMPALRNKNGGLRPAILGTIFGPVVGVSLSLYSVNTGNAAVAQTIMSMVPIFVLIAGYLFYRERISMASFIGSCVALCGVVMLIFRLELQRYVSGLLGS